MEKRKDRVKTLERVIADARKRIESNPDDRQYVAQQQDKIRDWTEELTARLVNHIYENPKLLGQGDKHMTNDEIKGEIQKRREQQKELQRQSAEIGREIAALKQQFSLEWKVGDRYETPKGRFEIRYLAVDDEGRIEHYHTKVNKLKKDGAPSQADQYPYGLNDAKRIS